MILGCGGTPKGARLRIIFHGSAAFRIVRDVVVLSQSVHESLFARCKRWPRGIVPPLSITEKASVFGHGIQHSDFTQLKQSNNHIKNLSKTIKTILKVIYHPYTKNTAAKCSKFRTGLKNKMYDNECKKVKNTLICHNEEQLYPCCKKR